MLVVRQGLDHRSATIRTCPFSPAFREVERRSQCGDLRREDHERVVSAVYQAAAIHRVLRQGASLFRLTEPQQDVG